MILTEYNIQYTTQKEIKGSVLADHLAHLAVDDYQFMNFEFPDENIMLVTDCEMKYSLLEKACCTLVWDAR